MKNQYAIDYWATVPKEERSRRAREAALAKHRKLTPQKKSEMGKKMAKARWKKVIPKK